MAIKTIIEPFKIKTVEPLRMTTRTQRQDVLTQAGYNLFGVRAENVLIDLLTDSGTCAMSATQWAGILDGDESYAGARSFYRFERVVKELTGFKHIIPTHQGRAAEKILFEIMGGAGKIIPSNSHFDTTRANIEVSGAEAVDLPVKEALTPSLVQDFKGNMNITALERLLKQKGREQVPLVMMTVTNNSCAGQPVSMGCIRRVSDLCRSYRIPFFIDACRFAENAWFIKTREPGCKGRSVKQLAQEMFSYADGCTMSGKKDGLVNIGGFLAVNDDALAQKARNILIVTEGFPTYGGLAGRDLEAFAQGLDEVLDEDYLKYRIRSVAYVVDKLDAMGVPVFKPAGGHAVYLDAAAFLPQIPPHRFPGQALACALYLEGGVRACEIGSVMFGKTDPATGDFQPAPMELVRLAIPRRVYTQSHMDYVVECIGELFSRRDKIKGMRIVQEPPLLRHFTAVFDPLE
jgi:tyrosine phenol-lyase